MQKYVVLRIVYMYLADVANGAKEKKTQATN